MPRAMADRRSGRDKPSDAPSSARVARFVLTPRRDGHARRGWEVTDDVARLDQERDLRQSRPLAMIDEISRGLTDRGDVAAVGSATQPTGDPGQLGRARIVQRLEEIGA